MYTNVFCLCLCGSNGIRCPKQILAVVDGYAMVGGAILDMMANLTLASTRSVAGKIGPRMGLFDAGCGLTHA